jgi:SulP family sulfate permease
LLLQPAFAIALLGAIESLLSAAAADTMTGNRHHSNQELIGQGLANIFTPIFGGFAATGAIARTATNIKNGGNSPIAALCHSAFLIAVIVLLAPFAAYIPMCSLAAILFVVAYHMSGVPHFINILRNESRFNSFVLLTTFSLTIFADLITAVITGVIIASMAPLTRRSLTLLGFADDSLPPKI